MRCRLLPEVLAAALLLLSPIGAGAEEPRARVGLFTTLPLYWREARGLADLIAPEATPPWARTAIEHDYDLVPLDVLGGEAGPLDGLSYLLLAQPRTLSPAENVALDAWVRGGGRLLLFADPMLTGESIFAVGDKRRPQDVALLSPILAHWGLALSFDDRVAPGEAVVPLGDGGLPVNLPGTLTLLAREPGAQARCDLAAGGLVAHCAIGAGKATIVADAALFDGDGATEARERALAALLTQAFAP